MLDTFLTPTLFLRYGRKPLERLVDQTRAAALREGSAGTAAGKTIEAF